MIKLIVWCVVIYLIYKFVFELLLPVSKATIKMKDTIRDMQEAQKNAFEQQTTISQSKTAAKPDADYIDYEEIK